MDCWIPSPLSPGGKSSGRLIGARVADGVYLEVPSLSCIPLKNVLQWHERGHGDRLGDLLPAGVIPARDLRADGTDVNPG